MNAETLLFKLSAMVGLHKVPDSQVFPTVFLLHHEGYDYVDIRLKVHVLTCQQDVRASVGNEHQWKLTEKQT